MKKAAQIVSALIMMFGLFLGFISYNTATTVLIQLVSLVPVITAYVAGRAIENIFN